MSQKQERYQKYLDMYHKLVLRNVKNLNEYIFAEDVTQEAFIKLYDHLDYLKEKDVKPWLLVVSANITKDYAKKHKKCEVTYLEEKIRESDKVMEEHLSTECSMEDIAIQKEEQEAARELLRTACDLLYERNPDWYFILIDSNMLEMNSKEIAEVLHMSVSRVNVERMRARKFLRKKLGEQYKEMF